MQGNGGFGGWQRRAMMEQVAEIKGERLAEGLSFVKCKRK